jgi:peptide/nickel transport system substrate-binding protein
VIRLVGWLFLLFTLVLTGCQPAAPSALPSSQAPAPSAPRVSRTLVMLTRVEPVSLATKPLQQAGTLLASTRRVYNATLALLDDRGIPRPYLAEALPQLNTDTWRVFPDGRMETTYRLAPNLTWHDGKPLEAEDFGFAYRVYSAPALGQANSAPQSLIEEVLTPDPLTVTIRWRQSYAEAGILTEGLPPLPRHLLEESFERGAGPEAFSADPFWTREYIGLGPYRVERWEPGSFIEGVAFDNHRLGRAKIDRLTLRWNSDANSALATFLAGEAQVSADSSLQFQQGAQLKREWSARNGGTVLFKPDLFRGTTAQQRPELATPYIIQDPRVRKALAHAIDKDALNDVLYEGDGFMTWSMIPSTVAYGPELERTVTKYPFDLRRSEAYMAELGIAKGADGFYASPGEGHLSFEVRTNGSPFFESEMSVLASGWRTAGFDFREFVNPAALAQDAQGRATFPSFFTASHGLGELNLIEYNSAGIPRAENRWVGINRGAWSNPDFDRLARTVNATLDRSQRAQLFVEMSRVFSEDLPVIPLYFQPSVNGFVAGLSGPTPVSPDTAMNWNLHEWELR